MKLTVDYCGRTGWKKYIKPMYRGRNNGVFLNTRVIVWLFWLFKFED